MSEEQNGADSRDEAKALGYHLMNQSHAATAFEAEGGIETLTVYDAPTKPERPAHDRGRTSPITFIAQALDRLRQKHLLLAAQVHDERLRQNVKFAGSQMDMQRHSSTTWVSILAEEFGEAAKELNDLYFGAGRVSQEHFNAIHARARVELIQTAAVAFAIIERLDDFDLALVSPEGTYPSDDPPTKGVA